jgi:hypothetical protein
MTMAKRTVHKNGLLRSTSVQYDLRDPEDMRASLEELRRISIRKDLGETLETKLRERLRDIRAAAVEIIGLHGYPTEDGVYLETRAGGYRKLSQREMKRIRNGAPEPGETRSFIVFPFFKYERLSRPELAARLVFEIDLLISKAAAGESAWPMVERALRFATAYHCFVFDATGANRLASTEYRRSLNQQASLKDLAKRRRAVASVRHDEVLEKAEAVRSKNPRLTRSAIADRIAPQLNYSSGHVRRILRSIEPVPESRD